MYIDTLHAVPLVANMIDIPIYNFAIILMNGESIDKDGEYLCYFMC